jgi:hypothetical protein
MVVSPEADMTTKAWFGPKWLGIGLSPSSWQGWLSLLAYIVIVGGGMRGISMAGLDDTRSGTAAVIYVAVITSLFLRLAWIKRDRTRPVKWRWFGR